MNDTLAIRQPQQYSLAPRNFDEAVRFAELVAKSELATKDYRGKPGNVMIAVQMGAELGLSPMQAIQNINVINGRPSVWGDAMLALCQAHPSFEDIAESDDGREATCTVKRKGRSPVTRTFSMDDAKQAGLAGKDGPWRNYPKRMRQMRARGFALRDAYADVLRGLQSAEESSDLPPIEAKATSVRQPEPRALQAEHEPEPPKSVPPPPANNNAPEPYRFKSGDCAGMAITEVPGAYLQRLSKHQLAKAMRERVDAELERRNSSAYIAEQLRGSVRHQDDSEGFELETVNEDGEVKTVDPWGLAHDATGRPTGETLKSFVDEPGSGDAP